VANKTELLTRNKKDATDWYPEIMAPLGKLKGSFVLDTEVCVLDEQGVPDFEGDANAWEAPGDPVRL
jgi:ATP-dependent DNA ligase